MYQKSIHALRTMFDITLAVNVTITLILFVYLLHIIVGQKYFIHLNPFSSTVTLIRILSKLRTRIHYTLINEAN